MTIYTRVERNVSHSPSHSPPRVRRSRSLPWPRGRSRSRSRDSGEAANPGNNLYVTGLSTRVTESQLEKYFSNEGKVVECHLVTDPRTRESRGFGFVTMETVEDADRCRVYGYFLSSAHPQKCCLITFGSRFLVFVSSPNSQSKPPPSRHELFIDISNSSIQAKRKRGRTPTPGKYHGVRERQGHNRRSPSYSPQRHRGRDRSRSRGHWERSRSPYGRREEYSANKRRRERSSSDADSGERS